MHPAPPPGHEPALDASGFASSTLQPDPEQLHRWQQRATGHDPDAPRWLLPALAVAVLLTLVCAAVFRLLR